MRHFRSPGNVVDCPERVRCRADGQQPRPLIELLRQVVPVQLTGFAIHAGDPNFYTAFPLQSLPWSDIAMVVEFGDHDFVSGLILAAESSTQMKGETGHVGAEDHFVRRTI